MPHVVKFGLNTPYLATSGGKVWRPEMRVIAQDGNCLL